MVDFYDELAPLYHLFFEDWEASIRWQGQRLSAILRREWPIHESVLDVSCGIGTQAIALAMQGYRVRGSDLSKQAVERAKAEAIARGQSIEFSICDMRRAHAHHGTGYDLVISCDNSVPHLLSDREIALALEQMHACLRPGGGCLLTVRDYERESRGMNIVKPYGACVEDGKRHVAIQVWDFDGDQYDLTIYFVQEDLSSRVVTSRALRSRYYAIGVARLCELLVEVGFSKVKRLDDVFYQPVIVGTKAA
jgi:SAM-dependent methyltransferase